MKRVSKKELNNSVFVPKKDKKISATKTLIYDKSGNECDYLPEDQIIAKVQNDGKSLKFYIRVNTENKFYRPGDKIYIDRSYRLTIKNALQPFSMKSVSKEVFDIYMTYLLTKKNDYYLQAERGL